MGEDAGKPEARLSVLLVGMPDTAVKESIEHGRTVVHYPLVTLPGPGFLC